MAFFADVVTVLLFHAFDVYCLFRLMAFMHFHFAPFLIRFISPYFEMLILLITPCFRHARCCHAISLQRDAAMIITIFFAMPRDERAAAIAAMRGCFACYADAMIYIFCFRYFRHFHFHAFSFALAMIRYFRRHFRYVALYDTAMPLILRFAATPSPIYAALLFCYLLLLAMPDAGVLLHALLTVFFVIR